jgi:hypothetical protein
VTARRSAPLHVVIKAPGSNLPTQSDQLSRDVVASRQRAQRLTGDEFISHLRFERDAITTMPGHGLYSPEARHWGANLDSKGPPAGAHSRVLANFWTAFNLWFPRFLDRGPLVDRNATVVRRESGVGAIMGCCGKVGVHRRVVRRATPHRYPGWS